MLAEAALYLDNPDFRRDDARRVARESEEHVLAPAPRRLRAEDAAAGISSRSGTRSRFRSRPRWPPSSRASRAHRRSAAPRLWDGKRPTTMAGWVALGREVFFGYPLRVEVFMNWALEHPDVGERVGVRAGARRHLSRRAPLHGRPGQERRSGSRARSATRASVKAARRRRRGAPRLRLRRAPPRVSRGHQASPSIPISRGG